MRTSKERGRGPPVVPVSTGVAKALACWALTRAHGKACGGFEMHAQSPLARGAASRRATGDPSLVLDFRLEATLDETGRHFGRLGLSVTSDEGDALRHF